MKGLRISKQVVGFAGTHLIDAMGYSSLFGRRGSEVGSPFGKLRHQPQEHPPNVTAKPKLARPSPRSQQRQRALHGRFQRALKAISNTLTSIGSKQRRAGPRQCVLHSRHTSTCCGRRWRGCWVEEHPRQRRFECRWPNSEPSPAQPSTLGVIEHLFD
jgi:hypothetical protein